MNEYELAHYRNLSNEEMERLLLSLVDQPDIVRVKDILECEEIKQKIDIDVDNGIILRKACYKGNLEMVQLLLTVSVDQQYPSLSSSTTGYTANFTYMSSPFRDACFSGNLELVKFLLQIQSDNNRIEKEQIHDGLYVAISLGYKEIISYLLDDPINKELIHFIELNTQPLKHSLFGYHQADVPKKKQTIELLKYLLKKYDLYRIKIENFDDEVYGTILSEFATRSDKEGIALIYPYFEKEHCKIEEAIITACYDKKIDNVEFLLAYQNFEISPDLKNRLPYNNSDVKALLEKIAFNEMLLKTLHEHEEDNETESRGKI